MHIITRHRAVYTAGVCLLLPTLAQATNGYLSHGYGTISKGLAGAGTALPQDAMSAATNVAGMVWVGKRMDIGASLFIPQREYTQRSSHNQFPAEAIAAGQAPPWPMPIGSENNFTGTVESDKDLFLIPHFGYAYPLNEMQTIGVALYGNGGMNTTYNAHDTTRLPAGTPAATGLGTYGGAMTNTATAGVDLAQVALNLNYSQKLNERLSIGTGLIVSYQQFKAKGLMPFGRMVADGNPNALSNNGREGVFGWGAQIGALWQLNEQWALGAAYQTRIDFNAFDEYTDLFADGGDLDAPPFVNIGVAFTPRPDLSFAVDVQHIWYSDVDALANPMTDNLMRCLAGQSQYCLGGDKGVGFGWRDMTVFKLGAQWAVQPDLTVRAGYSYGKQPVPEEGVMFNVLAPAVIEQHFTLGMTKQLTRRSDISLAAMYAPENDVTCGCQVPFAGGQDSINIAMSQWELEMSFGFKW